MHIGEAISGCHLVSPVDPVEHRAYQQCIFDRLTVSVRPNRTQVDDRPRIRDVRVDRCRLRRGRVMLLGVVLEDVMVHELEAPVSAQHCAFQRVVLTGKFRHEVVIRADMGPIDPQYWAGFGPDNDRRHADVDVALDVSEATFAAAMIRGIPPEKVRVDPDTQAVITCDSLAAGDARFREDQLVGTVGSQLARALSGDLLDHLVLVPSESPTAHAELSLVRELHARSLTLPAI